MAPRRKRRARTAAEDAAATAAIAAWRAHREIAPCWLPRHQDALRALNPGAELHVFLRAEPYHPLSAEAVGCISSSGVKLGYLPLAARVAGAPDAALPGESWVARLYNNGGGGAAHGAPQGTPRG